MGVPLSQKKKGSLLGGGPILISHLKRWSLFERRAVTVLSHPKKGSLFSGYPILAPHPKRSSLPGEVSPSGDNSNASPIPTRHSP